MINLQYLIICILGWFFGSCANELFEREVKGEGKTLPPSQWGYWFRLSWLRIALVKSLARIKILIGNQRDQRREAVRGFITELIVILTGLMVYKKYGFSGEGLAAFLFIYALILVFEIDLYKMIIPNRLNFILVGAHILFLLLGWSVSWRQAVGGAILGGGILFGIGYLCLIILKKEGMGGGDIKLAFACGIYLGTERILFGLLCSVYLAGFILLILLMMKRVKRNQYIPYGPFLAAGFLISLLFYEKIITLLWWL